MNYVDKKNRTFTRKGSRAPPLWCAGVGKHMHSTQACLAQAFGAIIR